MTFKALMIFNTLFYSFPNNGKKKLQSKSTNTLSVKIIYMYYDIGLIYKHIRKHTVRVDDSHTHSYEVIYFFCTSLCLRLCQWYSLKARIP